jgi:hypothetical protein
MLPQQFRTGIRPCCSARTDVHRDASALAVYVVAAESKSAADEWRLLAVGAIIALASGAIAHYVEKRIDRRHERAIGGRIEVLRRVHTERFEAARLLEGLLAELEHDLVHVQRGDAEYIELGRDHSRHIRVESRARVAVVGDEVREALERETDAALQYFKRVEGGERRALPTQWEEAQLNRKEVMLRVMRELKV